jgi:hypothetical protein
MTMPPAFQYDVFLSHSAKDKAVVRPLAERLRTCPGVAARRSRTDGLKVWLVPPKPPGVGGFDEWMLKPGASIPAKIDPPSPRSQRGAREGQEHSRVLACPAVAPTRRRMLCVSANAFGSDWAQLESGTFRFRDPLNRERRFLPLRLDDAPIKGSLAEFRDINCAPRGTDAGLGHFAFVPKTIQLAAAQSRNRGQLNMRQFTLCPRYV